MDNDNTGARALVASDFSKPLEAPLFKYVSNQTWAHMQRGSFQLGSAEYYRTIENPKIRDWMEGISQIHFPSGNKEAIVTLTTGFNCGIFCGTREVNGADHEQMMASFCGQGGGKYLKIEPVGEFAAHIKKRTRAFRVRLQDVVYTNANVFVAESIDAAGVCDHLCSKAAPDLESLNRAHFSTLYETALLPTLFVKPKTHQHERERRIAFEMRDNLPLPTVVFRDQTLLDFIKVVDASGS